MNGRCKDHEEGLATLAEGGVAPEAAAHVAVCPACAAREAELRRIVMSARLRQESADAALIARAQGLMAGRPRLVARLLGSGLAAAGARSTGAEAFALHVGAGGVSIRLAYAPAAGGWEILGRAPGEGWSVQRGDDETPCVPAGRFRLVVPSLDDAAFVLRSPQLDVAIPAAAELLDRGP